MYYPYRGMERKFPEGVPETFSKGVKDQNYISKWVRASFQGVIPVKTSLPGESCLEN